MLMEPNYYGLWLGKQAAKGTPNDAPTHRPIMVAGDFAITRDDGEENYSDLTKYGDRTDWVNGLTGAAEPGIEGTPEELAHLLWLFHGAEAVLAVPGPPAAARHRFTPAIGYGHWLTAFLRVGQSVIRRHKFNDSLITRIAIEASTANKALRVTPRILSLDPAENYAVDPAAGLPDAVPFLFTDLARARDELAPGLGGIVIDGMTFPGVTQFNLTVDDAWDTVPGDDAVPFTLVQGTPSVTVGATVAFDADALALLNGHVYGDPAPAVGAKPLRGIPALGGFKAGLRQVDDTGAPNGLGLDVEVPGVKWTPGAYPGPNPDGGATELALTGTMRPVAGQQPYTIDVLTPADVVAFTD